MSNLDLVSGQIIHALAFGDITWDNLRYAFSGDHKCYEKFPYPDSEIIKYFSENRQVYWDQLIENIGADAQARLNAINQSINPAFPIDREKIKDDIAQVVVPAWQKRELQRVLSSRVVSLDNETNTDAFLADLLAELKNIDQKKIGKPLAGSFLLADKTQQIIDSEAGLIPSLKIKTGFNRWDQSFGGGIHRGAISIVAGEEGSGKTGLVAQLILNNEKLRVLFICEMTPEEMNYRNAINHSSVSERDLMLLNDETFKGDEQADRERLAPLIKQNHIYKKISKSNLDIALRKIRYEQSANQNMLDIKNLIYRAAIELGGEIDILVLDHIRLFTPLNRKVSDADKVEEIYKDIRTHILKEFPRLAVITLQHINKEMIGSQSVSTVDGKRMIIPTHRVLKYGGSAYAHLAVVIIRDKMYEQLLGISKEKKEEWEKANGFEHQWHKWGAWVYNVKSRWGSGNKRLAFRYEGHFFRWYEWDTSKDYSNRENR